MSCGYEPSNKGDLGTHTCIKGDPFSDSDESAKIGSGEESSESEVDSNISEAEQSEAPRKRSNRIARKYFTKITSYQTYQIIINITV